MNEQQAGNDNKQAPEQKPTAPAQPVDTQEHVPIIAPVSAGLPAPDSEAEQTHIHKQLGDHDTEPSPQHPRERMRPAEKQLNIITAIIALATIANILVFYYESEDTSAKMGKLTSKAGEIVGIMNTALSNNREDIKQAFKANRDSVEAAETQSKTALDASIASENARNSVESSGPLITHSTTPFSS